MLHYKRKIISNGKANPPKHRRNKMALTRKYLKALGIEDEKIEQIIEEHAETVNALKAERDELKAAAGATADIQKQLEEAKKAAEEAKTLKEDLKKKSAEFEDYKKGVESKRAQDKKFAAYKELLKEAGVSEKRIETILKVSDLSKVELEEDGKVKGADDLKKNIQTEWSDFITTDRRQGAHTPNPPAGGSDDPDIEKMSMKEYIEYRKKK